MGVGKRSVVGKQSFIGPGIRGAGSGGESSIYLKTYM